MDALNLNLSELEGLKKDLLDFVHRVATTGIKSDAETAAMPDVVNLLLQNTGVIRLQDEQLKTVINALLKAEYEMTTNNGLIVTDVLDSNGFAKSSWPLDYSKLLKAIREAICILDLSVYSRKDNCPECSS